MVGVHFEFSTGTTENRYFHKDHLGSVAALTDDSGKLVEQDSYDAWGKRRYPNGSDDPTDSLSSQTTRGYTGEEELQAVALLHLNGRVYDPYLGRFTSADPLVGAEFSTQGWNRYAYVGNNPLRYTDPTGMCFLGCFFKRIFHSPIFRPLVAIAAAVTFNFEVLPAIEAPAFAASTTGLVVNGVIGGAVGGAISGDGNPQAILAGAFTAGAFGGLNAPSLSLSGFDKVAAFGVAGGIGNAIGGGNFQSGFLAAAATTLAMPNLPNFGPLGDTLEVATVGGTASVIGGGRFANGALTAAFAYLASPGNLVPLHKDYDSLVGTG